VRQFAMKQISTLDFSQVVTGHLLISEPFQRFMLGNR
jgi:hypothetical protein